MAHGTPKGEITETFEKRINDLEEKARLQSRSFRLNAGVRPWHTPTSMADRSLLDVPNLHEPAWNRDDANRVYSQQVLNLDVKAVGTSGDIACMKKQIDFMAAEERAWRLRHASLTRCAALAHGRLASHGVSTYGVFSLVKNVVDNHRTAGNDPLRS